MTRPGGRKGSQQRDETTAAQEPDKGVPIEDFLMRRLEAHPRYPAMVEAFERNLAPMRDFLGKLDATVAKLIAASNRAQALSDLIHSDDTGISDVREELKKAPIDNAMTLLFLLRLERERGESEIEREVADKIRQQASERGKEGAEKRHGKPGGARSKRSELRELWASGKYATRAVCAEQEYAALGVSLDTARKYLKGAPEPVKKAGR